MTDSKSPFSQAKCKAELPLGNVIFILALFYSNIFRIYDLFLLAAYSKGVHPSVDTTFTSAFPFVIRRTTTSQFSAYESKA
jgi:hypothetical protein